MFLYFFPPCFPSLLPLLNRGPKILHTLWEIWENFTKIYKTHFVSPFHGSRKYFFSQKICSIWTPVITTKSWWDFGDDSLFPWTPSTTLNTFKSSSLLKKPKILHWANLTFIICRKVFLLNCVALLYVFGGCRCEWSSASDFLLHSLLPLEFISEAEEAVKVTLLSLLRKASKSERKLWSKF